MLSLVPLPVTLLAAGVEEALERLNIALYGSSVERRGMHLLHHIPVLPALKSIRVGLGGENDII